MKKIESLLEEYGESHQNSTNKAIHWICVPLIFFSIVGLIWSIPAAMLQSIHPWFNWATLTLTLVLVYYIRLSPTLAIGMFFFSLLCIWAANLLANWAPIPLWQMSIIIFVAAWIGQFYGHKVEGKKPSFFKDLQFLLIGPAWLMHFIYKQIGIKYA